MRFVCFFTFWLYNNLRLHLFDDWLLLWDDSYLYLLVRFCKCLASWLGIVLFPKTVVVVLLLWLALHISWNSDLDLHWDSWTQCCLFSWWGVSLRWLNFIVMIWWWRLGKWWMLRNLCRNSWLCWDSWLLFDNISTPMNNFNITVTVAHNYQYIVFVWSVLQEVTFGCLHGESVWVSRE